MKIRFIFTVLILSAISCYGQKVKWQKVDQSYYGMKYELPKSWAIDGFGTSSVCHCAGTINTGNSSKKNEIQMVVYPALSDSALYNGMRTEVWDWKFVENENRTAYKAKSLTFEKTVSKWNGENTRLGLEPDFEVWRFTTSFKKQHYVIYFWAGKKILPRNEKMILEILNRFKAVNAGSDSEYW